MSNQTLMLGRNYETNKNTAIHTDEHGIFWDKLKHCRMDGRCFVVNSTHSVATETNNIFAIYNPSGSDKKVAIYDIYFYCNSGAGSNNIQFQYIPFTGTLTGGTSLTGVNLKIGHTSATTTLKSNGFTTTGDLTQIHTIRTLFATSTIDISENTNYYNEMIELPAATGIYIKMTANTGLQNINFSYTVKFVELDDNQDI